MAPKCFAIASKGSELRPVSPAWKIQQSMVNDYPNTVSINDGALAVPRGTICLTYGCRVLLRSSRITANEFPGHIICTIPEVRAEEPDFKRNWTTCEVIE